MFIQQFLDKNIHSQASSGRIKALTLSFLNFVKMHNFQLRPLSWNEINDIKKTKMT